MLIVVYSLKNKLPKYENWTKLGDEILTLYYKDSNLQQKVRS